MKKGMFGFGAILTILALPALPFRFAASSAKSQVAPEETLYSLAGYIFGFWRYWPYRFWFRV
jgi:hypothetical protein